MKKIIILFIILIILAAVAVNAYYFFVKNSEWNKLPTTQIQADQTAGWKTYQNEQYDFEVKYPKDWYYTDRSPETGTTATYNGMPYDFKIYFSDEKNDGVPPSRGGRGFISIIIYSGNMAELDAKEAEQGQYGAFNSEKKVQTTFNGLDAIKIEYNIRVPDSAPSSAFPCEQLRFEHNNKAFAIDFENSEKTTLLNQIYLNFLSTFKFTK